MKTLKLSATISSKADMNELVEAICIAKEQDSALMRDKFKMLDAPNSKTVQDLCKYLEIDVHFINSGKVNTVSTFVKVKNSFKFEFFEPKKKKKVEPVKDNFVSVKDLNKSDVDDDDLF